MSFSDAVSEMLSHLDSAVGSLPSPIGNANKLPADVVVVRSLEMQNSGIGLISEEDPISNKIIEQGQFASKIDVLLWSKENQNVVDRSRVLLNAIFDLSESETANGIFKKATLDKSQGPDYFDDGKLWRLSIGINLTFEYRFEEVPGTGIISEIPVSMEGELEEEFIVS